MPDILVLTLVAAGTALATGIGALPVIWLGTGVAARAPLLWGGAGGVMTVAAILGLLVPAVEDGGPLAAAGGTIAGIVAFWLVRRALDRRQDLAFGDLRGSDARRGLLVAGTLTAHSLPEGLAVGAAWASGEAVGLFVVLAIAIQNVPEGMVTAVPMREGNAGAWRTFWGATATSAPQIPGALIAYLVVSVVSSTLAVWFGLAAGAMLALVASEVVPAAARSPRAGLTGAVVGAVVMVVLAVLIGA